MSRTRIVKGNVTKIIGGDYKRFSKEDIENIGSKIIQIGKEGGVVYGEPEKPPIVGKKIVEMYWAYEEDNIRLTEKSKFFVDMNLIVKTINYKEGESVDVNIKSEDGEPIADGIQELNLSGTVDKNGISIFKEPLKNYTVKIYSEEEMENT